MLARRQARLCGSKLGSAGRRRAAEAPGPGDRRLLRRRRQRHLRRRLELDLLDLVGLERLLAAGAAQPAHGAGGHRARQAGPGSRRRRRRGAPRSPARARSRAARESRRSGSLRSSSERSTESSSGRVGESLNMRVGSQPGRAEVTDRDLAGCENCTMAIGAITRLYQRLGRRYPFTFLAVELQSALVVVAGTLALLTFYYEGSLSGLPADPRDHPGADRGGDHRHPASRPAAAAHDQRLDRRRARAGGDRAGLGGGGQHPAAPGQARPAGAGGRERGPLLRRRGA